MNNRRSFLKSIPIATAGLSVAVNPLNATASAPNLAKKRLIRIAHLTDIHVYPGGDSAKGMAKALNAAHNLADKADIIFNGGDCIMDSLKRKKDEVKAQWDVWNSVLKNELSLQMVNCIGNHDVWGWSNVGSKKKHDPLYGKLWATEELKLSKRYYSFDKQGCHFVVLDSTHHRPVAGYWAKLDEEQMEWLKADLKATSPTTPICILSHIPILSVCTYFDGENLKRNNWQVPGAWMHQDAKQLKDLFFQHKNVKTCLSGHIHLIDQAEYLGVKYYCNGAVCGAWWNGNCQEFPPSFAVINLYDDGTSDRELIYY